MPFVIACLTLFVALTAAQGLRPSRQDAPPPAVSIVPLPQFDGAHAIWGSTGQDTRGHIWFGITTGGLPVNSAHLIEFIPESGAIFDRGNVVAELATAGLNREGERQAKIHSRIVQGPGNFLYFASMDEDGENEDGSKLPTWGGHLWRRSLTTGRWEHLLRAREALIAVAGGDRFIYALGYFGHVLYQYDTRSGATARVEVGSVGGHISRNVIADHRGHVYVPRLRAEPATANAPRRVHVTLVEFDTTLHELRETPIDNALYLGRNSPTESHGIVGLQATPDGSILFTTHTGALFRITPPANRPGSPDPAPADVTTLGWLHPDGESYPASLFVSRDGRVISSLARATNGTWTWLACEISLTTCHVAPFQVPGLDAAALSRTLLYGSSTRDAHGGHYVVGIGNNYKPIALRILDE